jgi:hypothetical protein
MLQKGDWLPVFPIKLLRQMGQVDWSINRGLLSYTPFADGVIKMLHDSYFMCMDTLQLNGLVFLVLFFLSLFPLPVAPNFLHSACVLLQFLNPRTVSSSSQGRYLDKHRINADIHAMSGIQTHDPSVRAGEDSSCLRLRGHCNRLNCYWWRANRRMKVSRQYSIASSGPRFRFF